MIVHAKENDLYRLGVGLVLINSSKQLFVAKRLEKNSHVTHVSSSDIWQFPQGGIENNETPEEALHREMLEEIGTNAFTIIEQTSWIHYDFPETIRQNLWNGKYCGQQHIWFLCQLIVSDQAINLETTQPEFSEWKWVNPEEILENTFDFKHQAYQKILAHFDAWF